MKKILLFITLLLTLTNVEAKTYYSPYSEYSDYQLEPITSSDTMKVETEKRYQLYNENIYYEYLRTDPINKDFSKLNETIDFTSHWLDEEPPIKTNRTINTRTIYEYQDIKKIRYLHLYDMVGNAGLLQFGEIQIFDKDNNLINYLDKCDNCEQEYYQDARLTMNDNFFYTGYLAFTSDNILTLDLQDYYNLDEIKIRLYIYDFNITVPKTFKIKYTSEEDFNSNIYALADITEIFCFDYLFDMQPLDYDIGDFVLINPEYDEVVISEEIINPTPYRKVTVKTQYQYIDTFYKYEIKERNYLEGYYAETFDDYLIDKTTEKLFYRYKTRDKIITQDNIIIDNYDFDLHAFILETTTDDIKITSNINPYRNGTYKINFITPFRTITQDIVIDIKENYLKALEEQNKYLKELEKANNEAFLKINKYNATIKEILEEKDEQINKTNEQIIKYQYENEALKKNKEELKETNLEEKSSINKKFIIVIPIMTIIFILVKILKKRSNQNNN